MKTIPFLVILAMLAACRTEPAPDPDAEARAVLAADRAFAAMSEQQNPKAAFAAYMAPDGIMVPASTEGIVEGHDNVMAMFGEADDPGFDLLWQPQFAEVAASGDMAWTWGKYQYLVEGNTVRTGKYVNVWKKQFDGSWKVRVDVGNQQPQPPPAD
jgi:ketosteroid isomerase-like protein